MKKFFFSALLALAIASSAFAAGTKNVNAFAIRNFKTEFRTATNVSWTVTEEFAKATFTLNNQAMEAFYNTSGEMIGTSKNITLDQLPTTAKRNFAKRFEDYTVKEAIRFEGNDEAAYYISAENEKETVILKVGDNNQVSMFKRTKK